ncbi:hypothetical protein GUJ93_ZPchr0001g30555 [Zizania palustris]|uniref:Methyltransferase type 11 domain-containing protein n=1 Tax=Zizania palustris TaxID=103762 RepID=A0A8J5RKW7_ZIZPA|nr:hypothetical protein GUJ93_ZPchr0001g30555 [Zizania palustris]
MYAKKRPRYPDEWFSKIAALTAGHHRAWDAGCGCGQASVSIAGYYDSVVATDVSQGQLRHAMAHPKVRYLHTPEDLSEDDLVALVGGEGSLDLVVVATSIHWFDLPLFYAVVNRVLKPGGVLAVWGYNYDIHPFGDKLQGKLYAAMRPHMDPRTRLAMERYRELPFPFEPVGVGRVGEPADVDMEVDMTLDDLVGFLMTGSVVTTARKKGFDLEALVKDVMKEVEAAWGDPTVVRKLVFKAFMIAGKTKR